CFYWNSRRAAQDADLIVTNHALLLADALRGGTVLPPHEHLVVDEAHQLEETAVDALTMRVGEEDLLESVDGALTWFRAAIGAPGEAVRLAAAECRQAATEFFRAVRPVVAQGQPEVPLRPGREEPIILDASSRAWPESITLAKLAGILGERAIALRQALDGAGAQLPFESNPYAQRELDLFVTQLQARVDLVVQALLHPQPDRLYWIGAERRRGWRHRAGDRWPDDGALHVTSTIARRGGWSAWSLGTPPSQRAGAKRRWNSAPAPCAIPGGSTEHSAWKQQLLGGDRRPGRRAVLRGHRPLTVPGPERPAAASPERDAGGPVRTAGPSRGGVAPQATVRPS